jgi:demethylmenaquinone methyltransferase/2-methoxy-6-polyprenyl-1,4-benzoquinol methylase
VRALYLFYFERVLPRIGRWVSKHRTAYEWLPESTRSFPRPPELAARMKAAGFGDVGFRLFLGGVAALHTGARA